MFGVTLFYILLITVLMTEALPYSRDSVKNRKFIYIREIENEVYLLVGDVDLILALLCLFSQGKCIYSHPPDRGGPRVLWD